ncbi:recombination-associated protein RdgC [Pseudomaricurvus sp. HS19]|uniref:recombination-associated protein RdgC n=1 Tax=Pseudomaricurvus sp. HS19 TaxID=2692626 RepID=UPI00136AFED2|nr:recombination-associated protein RdgC [Pseudomaricurvus sp. HS19]MYM62771.1 recombination-associated protein RdgC [Pseudomaricurvus sp. HS19]
MWFKNLLVYRFTRPFDLSPEQLDEQLRKDQFTPCGSQETSQAGWVSPMGDLSQELCHTANGCIMLCARKEEKILPAAVVRERLEQRVQEIEAKEDRRVYRKEKETLKEEIIFECLPQAFTKSRRTFGYIDTQQGLLLVDASSYAAAEAWIKLLRESIGSLPVIAVQVVDTPARVMTDWLQGGELPEALENGDECEMREASEGGAIARMKKQDLSGDEIEAHLSAGKLVHKLALQWDEQVQFVLQDDLAIKRLRFSEKLVTEAQDASDGDKAAQFNADFALMTGTLQELLPALFSWFGGVNDHTPV